MVVVFQRFRITGWWFVSTYPSGNGKMPCKWGLNGKIMTGWWEKPTPKNDGVKVSWEYYIFSQYMESHKIPWFQTTNQLMTFCA